MNKKLLIFQNKSKMDILEIADKIGNRLGL